MKKYYRVLPDLESDANWLLGSAIISGGEVVDGRLFRQGIKYLGAKPAFIPLRKVGKCVDLNFCSSDMIVAPTELNARLEQAIGSETIQRIQVSVDGQHCSLEILNILDVINCVDKSKSRFDVFEPERYPDRPELHGKIRGFRPDGLRIDPLLAKGHGLFRIKEWMMAVICSEDIKRIIEGAETSGVRFKSVS